MYQYKERLLDCVHNCVRRFFVLTFVVFWDFMCMLTHFYTHKSTREFRVDLILLQLNYQDDKYFGSTLFVSCGRIRVFRQVNILNQRLNQQMYGTGYSWSSRKCIVERSISRKRNMIDR